jgi:hypothetical protein
MTHPSDDASPDGRFAFVCLSLDGTLESDCLSAFFASRIIFGFAKD